MNRREFLRYGGLAGAGLVAGNAAVKGTAVDGKSQAITFCVFADIHYSPGELPHDTHEWLQRILDRASKEKAEFVIQLGDFTHRDKNSEAYIKKYNNFSLPTYHVIGNHEADGRDYEGILKSYGMKCGYYFFDRKGFRFIVLDPNYMERNGSYRHCQRGTGYGSLLPPEQVKWLRETIFQSPHPCILLSHQSFEREKDGVKNYLEVRKIINDANRQFPGRVRLVMNGHYHTDNMRLLDGVLYWDVNSANYQWVDRAHHKYPEELMKTHTYAKNTIIYNDPLSAIVTLTADGGIRVAGQKSSLFMGITSEMTGNPRFDPMGREITANIQSIDLKLNI